MTKTINKRKKKAPLKRKHKPVNKRPTLVPAVLFLLLTAGSIGALYLVAGKHRPIQTPSTMQNTLTETQANSSKHQKPGLKHKNKQLSKPTLAVPQTSKLTIYRPNSDFTLLLTTSVTIKKKFTNKQKVQYIITLLTLPKNGDPAPLNQTTRLWSVSFKEQLITIDLSADIRKNLVNSGANDEIMAVACLCNSLLKNFPRYNSVQILIDGKKCRTLAGHIDISRPLSYQTGIDVKVD